jgi:hypothetical protein
MALEKFKAPPLPSIPSFVESRLRSYFDQFTRVLELYFSQLDSLTPNHAQSYRADNFYGGTFTGSGVGIDIPESRFASDETQTAADIADANVVDFNITVFSDEVTVVDGTKITPVSPGFYLFIFSLQFESQSISTESIDIWFRISGSDLANSNHKYGIPARKTASIFANKVANNTVLISLSAGQYAEIVWRVSDTAVALTKFDAVAADIDTPDIPATRSAKLRVIFVSA